MKQTRNKAWAMFLLLTSVTVQAYEPSLVHQHYVKWKGELPEPYGSIEVEIALEPQTDNVKHLEVLVGGKPVTFAEEDLARLKDLELGTVQMWQGIFRDPQSTDEPIANFMNDWIHIEIEVGERYRVQWEENGGTKSVWGKDKVTILITQGVKGSVHINKLQPPPMTTTHGAGKR